MNEALAAIREHQAVRDIIAGARALIFDVDGTLAETEEVHRRAFNEAFAEAGLDWFWDQVTYARLLRVAGGKERIRAFDQRKPGSVAELCRDRRTAPDQDRALCRADRGRRLPVAAGRACACLAAHAGAASGWRSRQRPRMATSMHCFRSRSGWTGPICLRRSWPVTMFRARNPRLMFMLRCWRRLGACAGGLHRRRGSGNGLPAASQAGIPAVVTRSAYFGNDDFDGALLVVDDLFGIDN